MKSSFTPGPWCQLMGELNLVRGKDKKISIRSQKHDKTICHLYGDRKADAALIMAAPDLLDALNVCRGQWIHSVNAEQCLAAIAKAEGKVK